LGSEPATRPSAASLKIQFEAPPQAAVVSAATIGAAPARSDPQQPQSMRRRNLAGIVAAALLALLVAAWAGLHVLHGQRPSQQGTASAQHATTVPLASEPSPAVAPPAKASASSARAAPRQSTPPPARAASRRPDKGPQQPADSSASVVHEEMPTPAATALRTIHGHLKVTVLVIVDHSGKVIDALLENPGPSPYFSRLARDAAKKWTFIPAEQDARQWLVRFEFSRDGATGNATPGS
jgi:TonB family protein